MTQSLLKKWTCCVTMSLAASATPAAAEDIAPALLITGNVTADVVGIVDGPGI